MTEHPDLNNLDPEALRRAIAAFADFARAIATAVETIAQAARQIDLDLIDLDELAQAQHADLRALGAQPFGAYSDDGSGWRSEWTIPQHNDPGAALALPAWRLN